MDYISKIYIDYLHSNNKYYDDDIVEKEVENAKKLLISNLTETQIDLLNSYLNVTHKLKTYKDLHLVEFVINYTKQ